MENKKRICAICGKEIKPDQRTYGLFNLAKPDATIPECHEECYKKSRKTNVRWHSQATRLRRNMTDAKAYIPKHLLPYLQDCFIDSDGYWAFFGDEVKDPDMDCHIAHGTTEKDFRQELEKFRIIK